MKSFTLSNEKDDIEAGTNHAEFIRTEDMSVEVMRYSVDDEDPMHSHDVEEVYYIDSGSASINVEGDVTELSGGDVIHVRPDETHRFQDFVEELIVLGFYAPATKE